MSAIVLAFPPRNKGRIRKTQGLETMGRLVLSVLQRDGEAVPANVVCIDEPEGPDTSMVEKSEPVLLALCVYAELAKAQKKSIIDQLGFLARNGDRVAQRVLNTLTAAK